MGCCAVASRIGGNPELVRHDETGLLFQPGDSGSLASQLRSVVYDDARRERLASAAARFVAENFNKTRSIERMQQIYTMFLERG